MTQHSGGERTADLIAGSLEFPMTIVTAAAGDERSGCLVGFATQCSIDPMRFAVFLSVRNHTFRVAQRAKALAIHFPSVDDEELAVLFGHETTDATDKFARCSWHLAATGAPVLDDCQRWVSGPICGDFPAGDHHGYLVEVAMAHDGDWPGQYGFQRAKGMSPGHEA